MPEDPANRNGPVPDPEWRFRMFIAGILSVGLMVLWQLCRALSDPRDFWTVFIGGSVNLFILAAMLAQSHISRQQWLAMREQLDYAKHALEVVERPSVYVTHASFGHSYPNLTPEITIENKGRTEARHVRLQFGIAEEELMADVLDERRFRDGYPGHASGDWCRLLTLAAGGVEVLSYDNADSVRINKPPGSPWGNPLLIYGHGFYEGLGGKEYEIPKFAFRVVPTPTSQSLFALVRDDSLYYEWSRKDSGEK